MSFMSYQWREPSIRRVWLREIAAEAAAGKIEVEEAVDSVVEIEKVEVSEVEEMEIEVDTEVEATETEKEVATEVEATEVEEDTEAEEMENLQVTEAVSTIALAGAEDSD